VTVRVRMGPIKIPNFPPPDLMDKIANAIRTAVLERIERGETVDGQPMLVGPPRIFDIFVRGETNLTKGGWEKHGGSFLPKMNRGKGSWSSARYSYYYEKWKSEQSRDVYEPGDRFRFSGDMLRAWQVLVVELTRCVVGFTSTGEALKALGNHERRPTFSLNKEEVDAIIDEVCEKYGWRRG
jgi:hypothetical protein